MSELAVVLRATEGGGRYAAAATDVPSGALVHKSLPFSLSVHPDHAASRCTSCLTCLDATPRSNTSSGAVASGGGRRAPKQQSQKPSSARSKMKNANYLAMKAMLSAKKQCTMGRSDVERELQGDATTATNDVGVEEADVKAVGVGNCASAKDNDDAHLEKELGSVSSTSPCCGRYRAVELGKLAVECRWCGARYCTASCAAAAEGRHAGLQCRMLQALTRVSAHRSMQELHYLRCLADIIIRATSEGFGQSLSNSNNSNKDCSNSRSARELARAAALAPLSCSATVQKTVVASGGSSNNNDSFMEEEKNQQGDDDAAAHSRRLEENDSHIPPPAAAQQVSETERVLGDAVSAAARRGPCDNNKGGRPIATSVEIPAEALRLRQRRQQQFGSQGRHKVEVVDERNAISDAQIEALMRLGQPSLTAPVHLTPCGAVDDTKHQCQPLVGKEDAPEWQHFASLVSNVGDMPREQLSKYSTLYRLYLKLVGEMYANKPQSTVPAVLDETQEGSGGTSVDNNVSNHGDDKNLVLRAVSEGMFHSICAALQCNGFGIYDAAESCLAIATYPVASFFNHSCNPNIGRVMRGRVAEFYALRDIAAGEPLTISYVDAEKTTSERRHVLLASYRFWCECERCSGAVVLSAPRCSACSARGYLIPFVNLPVGTGECSVCHTVAARSTQ